MHFVKGIVFFIHFTEPYILGDLAALREIFINNTVQKYPREIALEIFLFDLNIYLYRRFEIVPP
jgi:hypothetical protein